MFLLKALLRFLLFIGIITIIPFVIWWIFTGMDWFDTEDEIDYL